MTMEMPSQTSFRFSRNAAHQFGRSGSLQNTPTKNGTACCICNLGITTSYNGLLHRGRHEYPLHYRT